MIYVSVKPTTECNLNCLYCNLEKRSKASLSLSTVKDFFSFLVEKFPEEKINGRWGGGESLLMGFDFLILQLNGRKSFLKILKMKFLQI